MALQGGDRRAAGARVELHELAALHVCHVERDIFRHSAEAACQLGFGAGGGGAGRFRAEGGGGQTVEGERPLVPLQDGFGQRGERDRLRRIGR